MKFTNKYNINIVLQMSLLYSDYDYDSDKRTFSATGLTKSLKQMVKYASGAKASMELQQNLPSLLGSHVHSIIELVLLNPKLRKKYLKLLRYKGRELLINPSKKQLNKKKNKKKTVIWVEQRAKKKFGKFKVSGKYDHIIDSVLHDTKVVKAFSYQLAIKQEAKFKELNDPDEPIVLRYERMQEACPDYLKYVIQGSIYRMLNPDKIKEDYMIIEFLLKDWSAGNRDQFPGYPMSMIMEYTVDLFSIKDTETWVKSRLKEINTYVVKKSKKVPDCTKAELWMGDDVYKYFSKPTNKKASKTFKNDATAAYDYLESKGGIGEIRVVRGQASACNWCVFSKYSCNQYKDLKRQGLIKDNKI